MSVTCSTVLSAIVLLVVAQRVRSLVLSKLPPHAGYHGAIATPFEPFFEGWYLRITPTQEDWDGGPLAFIFHVFDPQLATSKRRGVGMQVLTDQGTVVVETSDVSSFRADPHQLDIKNRFGDGGGGAANQDYFDLTARRLAGRASSSSNRVIEFDFDLAPEIGWGGGERSRQYSTAGWLAAFPIFEPHYQILISDGKASGSLRVQSSSLSGGRNNNGSNRGETKVTTVNLKDAKLYLEKNWGSSFPSKWWWIQANAFLSGALCVTSTGAKRRVPLVNEEEEVALVGVHYKGQFLPFPNVDWKVEWGTWEISGSYQEYRVLLNGSCNEEGDDDGVYVRCPTPEGMKETALETYRGKLRVRVYQSNLLLVDETTDNACLEIGGLPWKDQSGAQRWEGRSAMMEPVGRIAMNPDLERFGSDVLELVGNFINIPGL